MIRRWMRSRNRRMRKGRKSNADEIELEWMREVECKQG